MTGYRISVAGGRTGPLQDLPRGGYLHDASTQGVRGGRTGPLQTLTATVIRCVLVGGDRRVELEGMGARIRAREFGV